MLVCSAALCTLRPGRAPKSSTMSSEPSQAAATAAAAPSGASVSSTILLPVDVSNDESKHAREGPENKQQVTPQASPAAALPSTSPVDAVVPHSKRNREEYDYDVVPDGMDADEWGSMSKKARKKHIRWMQWKQRKKARVAEKKRRVREAKKAAGLVRVARKKTPEQEKLGAWVGVKGVCAGACGHVTESLPPVWRAANVWGQPRKPKSAEPPRRKLGVTKFQVANGLFLTFRFEN